MTLRIARRATLRRRTLPKAGALRYHGVPPQRLGEVLRLRAVARLGVDVRVGIGRSVTVAATASAQITGPGGVLVIEPGREAEWLGPLPVSALYGIGPLLTELRGKFPQVSACFC
ncbi:hypothetical protein R6V09_00570 [Streptomyces sp. W16]|uniref:hypothetical protein n=1 Tax=Streptomyces sp. W16 TaxID=3076631 RepID=UPI00295BF964|nr:hypothetical protein [Streptomyces sp. W16]MDV9168636.1 hypothetical protein [Streptomyces sp. W16]